MARNRIEIPLGHVKGNGWMPYVHPRKVDKMRKAIRAAHYLLGSGDVDRARSLLAESIDLYGEHLHAVASREEQRGS